MPRKFMKSISCARAGAKHAFATQRNLWIHFIIALGVLALALWLKVKALEFSILLMVSFLVIVAELLNTAIEELVNILSPEHRKEAGLAKNVAAAAVLLAALGAVVVGGIIFLPRFIVCLR